MINFSLFERKVNILRSGEGQYLFRRLRRHLPHSPRIYKFFIKAQGKAWGQYLFRRLRRHLPHTISVSRFCQKDGGEGLAARRFKGMMAWLKSKCRCPKSMKNT